jgi:hypothetical protein
VDLVSVKLGRLSVGAAKPARNGIEDMMASVEGGKHDYDWYVCYNLHSIHYDLLLVEVEFGQNKKEGKK